MLILSAVVFGTCFITLFLAYVLPYELKGRAKQMGVNLTTSQVKRRVKEEKERYKHRLEKNDYDSLFLMLSILVGIVSILTCLVSRSFVPLISILLVICAEHLPFTLTQLFSRKIKTYVLFDKNTLRTVVLFNTAGLNMEPGVQWTSNLQLQLTNAGLDLGKDEFFNLLLNQDIKRTEHIVRLANIAEIAQDYRHAKLALKNAWDVKLKNLKTMEKEELKELETVMEQTRTRKNELKKQLFESDKLYFHSIGVLEEPGIVLVNEALDYKEPKEPVQIQPIKTYISPAVEALLQIIQDPNTDEEIRKHALDTVKEIELKTLAQENKAEKEYKKNDAMSTIIAARKVHHLDEE